eukprot:scaffold5064_cov121-Cylindrotheca_fusiformis.AAC.18
MATGWDTPPPIASPIKGEWTARDIKWQTPQRIATLECEESITCHPILIQNRYLLVAGAGFVSVFSIDVSLDSSLSLSSESSSSFWKPTSPTLQLSLESDAVLVQLLVVDEDPIPCERNTTKQCIFALSEEGDIYNLSFSVNGTKDVASLVCEESWNTGSFGSSCFAILPRDNDLSKFHLLVGYDSGHLEGWKSSHSDEQKTSALEFSMQWKGLMQTPIRSITPFGQHNRMDDDEGMSSLVVTGDATDTGTYMNSTASMVDVLELDFKVFRKKFISNNRQHISLEPYLQLPTFGMELVDSATNGCRSLLRKVSNLPSKGTDVTIRFHDGRQCGVALSDGSVAILSSQTELRHASSSWGITNDVHQLLFSYPVVGCGHIHMDDIHYMACCLRAGTCFMIPLSALEKGIVAVPYPHDVDLDCTSLYIQGFTSGELRVSSTGNGGSRSCTLPILVYAAAGGLDVYSCGLVYPKVKDVRKEKEQAEQRIFLKKTLESDLLPLVVKIMNQMENDDTDALWQDSRWKAAHSEVKALPSFSESITAEQLSGHSFSSLKNLLILLGSP